MAAEAADTVAQEAMVATVLAAAAATPAGAVPAETAETTPAEEAVVDTGVEEARAEVMLFPRALAAAEAVEEASLQTAVPEDTEARPQK